MSLLPDGSRTSSDLPPLRVVGAEELRATLSIAAAADALEAAFRDHRLPTAPLRASHPLGGGELLLMPAWGEIGIGVKLVTVDTAARAAGQPRVQGLFALFSADRMAPVAVLDGAALTAIRTAAVSALGTRHLARDDARVLLLFGAGIQAHVHLEAMCEVCELSSVVVVAPTADRAAELVARAVDLGLQARVGEPDDVREADVVCCCTNSREPVFRGELLPPGAHVNAIGAYRPDTREVDLDLLRRSTVVVDDREAALAEAGDLIVPISQGSWRSEQIAGDLAEVVRGRRRRRDDVEVTLLKTVGLAWEDLVVARAALDRLAEPG